MELMRHSDMKLTMRTYTDSQHLPLASELARLPSYNVPEMHTQRIHTHGPFWGKLRRKLTQRGICNLSP